MYSSMQPFVRPEISDLMNERIDVLSEFKMLGKEESERRWMHATGTQQVSTGHFFYEIFGMS